MTDWNEIKFQYISGRQNPRELAEQYGMSARTVERHLKAENWKEEKLRYSKHLMDKSVEKAAEQQSNALAKLVTATAKAVDVAARALEDEEQFKRYLVTEGSETQEKTFDKLDTKALRKLRRKPILKP